MYFRFMSQRVGIPTINNRLYLKLGKLGFSRTYITTVTYGEENSLNYSKLVEYNTWINY